MSKLSHLYLVYHADILAQLCTSSEVNTSINSCLVILTEFQHAFRMVRFFVQNVLLFFGSVKQDVSNFGWHNLVPQFKWFWALFFFIPFQKLKEPLHDKINKMTCAPAKTQISLFIRQVWSVSSLSPWRNLGSLATQLAHSEDWSGWVDAQADLSLRWVHRSFCWFWCAAAQNSFLLFCKHLQQKAFRALWYKFSTFTTKPNCATCSRQMLPSAFLPTSTLEI